MRDKLNYVHYSDEPYLNKRKQINASRGLHYEEFVPTKGAKFEILDFLII